MHGGSVKLDCWGPEQVETINAHLLGLLSQQGNAIAIKDLGTRER